MHVHKHGMISVLQDQTLPPIASGPEGLARLHDVRSFGRLQGIYTHNIHGVERRSIEGGATSIVPAYRNYLGSDPRTSRLPWAVNREPRRLMTRFKISTQKCSQ